MPRSVIKGDMVVVIAGDDKGRVGEVLRVDSNDRRNIPNSGSLRNLA